nr:hypothetical protein BaRGS_022072 [Batillaria attramentaria]
MRYRAIFRQPCGGSLSVAEENANNGTCLGPVSDFSFETILSRNLSFQQYVFLHDTSSTAPPPLLQLNGTTVYRTAIVPNDPADFGRNSYNMQTINNKVDDNYLYGWYKTLYSLFHSAGFRLYHTAASSPLCLQVTMMESCRYFTSWVRNPGPRTFVYYPPAIDGSAQYEEQRLEDFLDRPSQLDEDVIPVKLSPYTTLRLSRRVLMSGSDSCTILIFQDETSRREVMGLADIISHYLFSQSTKVVFLDLRHVTWQFLTPFLDSGALQIFWGLVETDVCEKVTGILRVC